MPEAALCATSARLQVLGKRSAHRGELELWLKMIRIERADYGESCLCVLA